MTNDKVKEVLSHLNNAIGSLTVDKEGIVLSINQYNEELEARLILEKAKLDILKLQQENIEINIINNGAKIESINLDGLSVKETLKKVY